MNAVFISMDVVSNADTPTRFAPTKLTRRVDGVSDDEDAQLMLAYASGEMRAFESLYARHRGRDQACGGASGATDRGRTPM